MATLFGSTITVFARFMPLTHALSLPMEIHGVLQMADLPDIRCWYKTTSTSRLVFSEFSTASTAQASAHGGTAGSVSCL